MEYLMNIDSDTESINLCYKEIGGILDFKRFNKLKKIDCSFNKIVSIINLPSSLISLSCSYNCIRSLHNLPHNLLFLDCSCNCILLFNNLPITLNELHFSKYKKKSLQSDLPLSIKIIYYYDDRDISQKLSIINLPLLLKIFGYTGCKTFKLKKLPSFLRLLHKNNIRLYF